MRQSQTDFRRKILALRDRSRERLWLVPAKLVILFTQRPALRNHLLSLSVARCFSFSFSSSSYLYPRSSSLLRCRWQVCAGARKSRQFALRRLHEGGRRERRGRKKEKLKKYRGEEREANYLASPEKCAAAPGTLQLKTRREFLQS